MLNNAIKIIFVFWILVLILRSGIYITRIIKEFNAPQSLGQTVDPCSKTNETSDTEKEKLTNYLSIGKVCTK